MEPEVNRLEMNHNVARDGFSGTKRSGLLIEASMTEVVAHQNKACYSHHLIIP